jgi:hypothetical protein
MYSTSNNGNNNGSSNENSNEISNGLLLKFDFQYFLETKGKYWLNDQHLLSIQNNEKQYQEEKQSKTKQKQIHYSNNNPTFTLKNYNKNNKNNNNSKEKIKLSKNNKVRIPFNKKINKNIGKNNQCRSPPSYHYKSKTKNKNNVKQRMSQFQNSFQIPQKKNFKSSIQEYNYHMKQKMLQYQFTINVSNNSQ